MSDDKPLQSKHGPTWEKASPEGEILFRALQKAFPRTWVHADYVPSGKDGKPSWLSMQLGEGYDWQRYETMRVNRKKITPEWAAELVAQFKTMVTQTWGKTTVQEDL